MQLRTDTVLAGKYIILMGLFEGESYYMYLAKAPTLGEEFIITEFYPRSIAIRDDSDFVTIGPENAEEFEIKLEKFISDSRRLMSSMANRFFGVSEVLSELGTAYIVSKKPAGELLTQFIETMGTAAGSPAQGEPQVIGDSFNEAVIDGAFEAMRSVANNGICLDVQPGTVYAENVGSLTFIYDYKFDMNAGEIIENIAKTIYCLITKKEYDNFYDPRLLENSKYRVILTGIFGKTGEFNTLEKLNHGAEKYILQNKKVSVKSYIANVIIYTIFALALGGGAAYGVYWLINKFFG